MVLTQEILVLTFISLLLLFGWIPSSLAKYQQYGREYLFSNRDQTALEPLRGWGGRAERAYQNLKDYYPPFLASMVILQWMQKTDMHTGKAAVIFAMARVLHFIVYIAGPKFPRTACWFVALCSQIYLYCRIFY